MKLVKNLLVLSAFTVIFGGIFATAAIAQNPKGSSLRLEQPLEIGGTVLEPGVYMITVVPGDRRDVLKVTGEDGEKTFATVLTTPHPTPATMEQKRTQYVYFPATAGSARALRTWFAPNSATGDGYDIVYPERRALELAIVANEPVVAYKDLNTAELEWVAPDQEVTAYVSPNHAAPYEEEDSVEVAQASDQPMGDRELQPMGDRELPATASPMPFLGILGFLLLLTAGGVRILRTV